MPAANPPHEFLYIYSMPEKYQNENRKAKKTKPQKNLDFMRVSARQACSTGYQKRKKNAKKNCAPMATRKSHHRDTKPQPAVRSVRRGWGGCTHYCIHKAAACSCQQGCSQGYTKKEQKKMYTLLYTQRIKLCTYYRIQCRMDYVHTTLHTARRIVYTLPYTKRKTKKRSKKDRLGCTQMEWGFACGSRREETS